jgi:hypothetical protein
MSQAGGAIKEITALIERLRQPLTDEDRRDKWSPVSQAEWRQHFEDLRARLGAGAEPQGDQYHLMRWLNFDGIAAGELAEAANRIQRQLWDLFASDKARRDWSSEFTGSEARKLLRKRGIRP